MVDVSHIILLIHNLTLFGVVILVVLASQQDWPIAKLRSYVLMLAMVAIASLAIVSWADLPRLLGLSMAVVGYAFAAIGIYVVKYHRYRR